MNTAAGSRGWKGVIHTPVLSWVQMDSGQVHIKDEVSVLHPR